MLLDAGEDQQCPVLVGMLRPSPLFPSDSCWQSQCCSCTPQCHLALLSPPRAGLHTRKGDTMSGSVPSPWKVHQGEREDRKLFPTLSQHRCVSPSA